MSALRRLGTASAVLAALTLVACSRANQAATTPTSLAVGEPNGEPGGTPKVSTGTCDERQAAISQEADERAAPYGIVAHLQKNFADGRVSWLMKETPYQNYVVKTGAKNFGRCDDTGCYLFAAPSKVIEEAVAKSTAAGGAHDPAVLGQALGLPAANFEGPLRMMTLELSAAPGACARLPVDADPGVWKCQTPDDKDCFKFGGYTSGSVPEVMIINAPVDKTQVREVQ